MLAPLALAGCPDRVGPIVNCAYGNDGFQCTKWGLWLEWNFHLASAETPIAFTGGFDVSQASANFSQSSSNVAVTTNSGYAVVKLFLSNGSVVTNAFPWVRQGNLIVAQNPSAVNNWVNAYLNDIVDAEVDLGAISGTGNEGANTLVGQANYAGTVYGGATYSWYQRCDPTDPFGTCQHD